MIVWEDHDMDDYVLQTDVALAIREKRERERRKDLQKIINISYGSCFDYLCWEIAKIEASPFIGKTRSAGVEEYLLLVEEAARNRMYNDAVFHARVEALAHLMMEFVDAAKSIVEP